MTRPLGSVPFRVERDNRHLTAAAVLNG
jgi:hypothetical protein